MRLDNRNYILGAGEQLVETVLPPPRAPRESKPYTIGEARLRLIPRLQATTTELRRVPENALPAGEAVAALTLHPQFLSKSAYPTDLLAEVGLRAVGSKPSRVTPEKVARVSQPHEEATATLFVAGTLPAFDRFTQALERGDSGLTARAAEELTAIEDFRAMTPADRVTPFVVDQVHPLLECVLHARSSSRDAQIVESFERFAERLGLRVDRQHELFASGLCFLAVNGEQDAITELAWFSFLRRIRPMPRMRPLLPTRIARAATGVPVQIPTGHPLDESVVCAIFDTPLPPEHALESWTKRHDYAVTPYSDDDARLHGLCVASAAMLGPLDNVKAGEVPYTLHHHGILGEDPDGTGYHAALKIIQEQVEKQDYKLFNLSFGPDGAIEDGDVDAFTAVVDDLLAGGKRLAFIAVGNDGDLDDEQQLNRIQPPSDAVNALAVGASHSRQSNWQRADYSCVGPGRLGCRVKPDMIAFGGSLDEPFGCIGPGSVPDRFNTQGTSFASPTAMRIAGTVLATMGDQLPPVALRGLLVHGCRQEERTKKDVGHGLIQSDVLQLLTSQGDEVKILFHGNLVAGKYVRHEVPLPSNLEGLVELQATLCFASQVDPNFPSAYVQAGIEALFRPHSQRFGTITNPDGTTRPSLTIKSEPLFSQGRAYGAADDRRDAHHWDTVLKVQKNKRAASLQDPAIELHYNRREAGHPDAATNQPEIPYALVLTIRCKAVNDLYDQVRIKYGANLRVLTPRIEIPVRT